jgi:dTDP-L-rhamnose 4-epimerase
VYEDGKQLRDYIHVSDVAQANMLVLEAPGADYRVFNVGGDNIISVLEYAYLLAEKLGKDIEPLVPGVFRFGDTRHIASDACKIQALGWKAKMPLAKIVEDYIAWVSEQPHVADYYADAEKVMEQVGTIVKANR